MLYQMMGIERFGLDYYERRDLFDSLYHTMCERYDELFDIAAGSPVEMILMGDNISGDDDHLPDREIAAKVGVNTATLTRWKLHPEFRARVAQEREDLLRRLRHRPSATRTRGSLNWSTLTACCGTSLPSAPRVSSTVDRPVGRQGSSSAPRGGCPQATGDAW